MRAQEVSRRALAAVARLTFIAGAAGCAGSVVVEKGETVGDPDPGEAQPHEPPDATVDPAEGTCFEDVNDTAACCTALLSEAFSDDQLFADPTLATDEERACCDLAVTTMDTWAGPGLPPFDYAITSSCCSTGLVEDAWDAHPSCTPWGPPMPPAMPAGFAFEVLA